MIISTIMMMSMFMSMIMSTIKRTRTMKRTYTMKMMSMIMIMSTVKMTFMMKMMRVFLFRAGTDLTTLDNNGRTPLQLAQVLVMLSLDKSKHFCDFLRLIYVMRQAKLKILQKKKGGEGGEEMVNVKAEVTMRIILMGGEKNPEKLTPLKSFT